MRQDFNGEFLPDLPSTDPRDVINKDAEWYEAQIRELNAQLAEAKDLERASYEKWEEAAAEVLTLKRKDREWYEAAEKLRAEVERLRPLQSPALFAEVERLRAKLKAVAEECAKLRWQDAQELERAEAKLKAVVEALEWLLNLLHGVSRNGGEPAPSEFEVAGQEAEAALAAAKESSA